MYVEYDSNNSVGSWRLNDEDWKALEQAGWVVEWRKAKFTGASATDVIHYVKLSMNGKKLPSRTLLMPGVVVVGNRTSFGLLFHVVGHMESISC